MTDLAYTLTSHRPPQIGLIVLQSDETIEIDARRLFPAEVEVLVTRVPSGAHVTPASLAAMEGCLTGAAKMFPSGAQFSAVGYCCTSGTAQIGAARVATLIRAGIATAEVSEPVSALIAACHNLGLRRIGMISPYVESVSTTLRAVVTGANIDIVRFASFNQSEEAAVARIAPDAIRQAACDMAADPACEAIFLSCTNLRTLDVINEVEQSCGKPILSSNQVLCWHLGRLVALSKPAQAPGVLWHAQGNYTGV